MVLSVSQAIEHLNSIIRMDDVLNDVCVLGEVSRVSKASSGHCYFSIRDSEAILDSVIFRGGHGSDYVEMGQEVFVFGRFSVYPNQGRLQLVSELVQPAGIGSIQVQFEKIRHRLEAEGLFDESRKRTLPAYPNVVGVVTSEDSAAWEDIKRTVSVRYPEALLKLAHTLVQGEDAAEMISDAVKRMGMEQVDAIVLARGGGSPEDLWPFNEEIVARAIFASNVPVVTGIGHETDWTIADLVADMRASTPTYAAMQLFPNRADIIEKIDGMTFSMAASMKWIVGNKSSVKNDFVNKLELEMPNFETVKLRLDDLVNRSERVIDHSVKLPWSVVEGIRQNLKSLGPLNTVKRGYSIVRTADDNTIVRRRHDVDLGDDIFVTLIDGEIKAKVIDGDASDL